MKAYHQRILRAGQLDKVLGAYRNKYKVKQCRKIVNYLVNRCMRIVELLRVITIKHIVDYLTETLHLAGVAL